MLAGAGLGEVQIQRYGDADAQRDPDQDAAGRRAAGGQPRPGRAARSRQRYGKGDDRPDLNQIGAATLTDLLYAADPDQQVASGETAAREHYRAIAERVMAARRDRGLFGSYEELAAVEGLSAEAHGGAARPHLAGRLLDRERRERRARRSAASCAPAACSRWCSRCSA